MPLISDADRQDPQAMRAAVRAFPDHLRTGWEAGADADALGVYDGIDGVVVCGMGGSAIGGDLVRALVEAEAGVPFVVNRGYGLPAWVGERTLVVASSYSGGTEETLSAHAAARARGARIVVVTSGGEIAARAAARREPVIEIPGGLQPRAALGYSLGVVLRLARAAGLVALPDADVEAALTAAADRAARLDADAGEASREAGEASREAGEASREAGEASREAGEANPAQALAASWEGRLPVVYTGVGLLEPVGMRWRTQIHENAKHPAVGNVFPELDHNEIMGFEAAPPEIASRMAVVVLTDADDHPQVQKRVAATRSLVEGAVASWQDVPSEGASRLDRVLSLVQLGDWASFWLAMRKGVDPTPVDTIQALKAQLAG